MCIAFVGILVVAARRAGFSLRPQLAHGPTRTLRRLIRHSGWGVLLHANVGLLLGAALIVGNSVAGGVVAYQVAFVFFLAPYAVLAQPVHTAILPELANEAKRRRPRRVRALDRVDARSDGGADRSGRRPRWSCCAVPSMRLVAFGGADAQRSRAHRGGTRLARASACLPYAALLLFARAFYALDDSRTPAIVAIASALVGVATMVALVPFTHGCRASPRWALDTRPGTRSARSCSACCSAAASADRSRCEALVVAVLWSAGLGAALWIAITAVDPQGRLADPGCARGIGGGRRRALRIRSSAMVARGPDDREPWWTREGTPRGRSARRHSSWFPPRPTRRRSRSRPEGARACVARAHVASGVAGHGATSCAHCSIAAAWRA